jgi:hypothetical protein
MSLFREIVQLVRNISGSNKVGFQLTLFTRNWRGFMKAQAVALNERNYKPGKYSRGFC